MILKKNKKIGRGQSKREFLVQSGTCPEATERSRKFNRESQLLYEWLISYS
jgi:hypothetical protein